MILRPLSFEASGSCVEAIVVDSGGFEGNKDVWLWPGLYLRLKCDISTISE